MTKSVKALVEWQMRATKEQQQWGHVAEQQVARTHSIEQYSTKKAIHNTTSTPQHIRIDAVM